MGAAGSAGSGVYCDHSLIDSDFVTSLLDHVGVGVCAVDGELNVIAINRPACEILDFPDDLIRPGLTLETLVRFNAARGDFGEGDIEDMVRERLEVARTVKAESFEYTQVDGTIVEVKRNLLPDGGFITTYTGAPVARRTSVTAMEPAPTEPDTGEVATCEAPAQAAMVQMAPRSAPRPPAKQPARLAGMIDVVIAEDSEENQQVLSGILEDAGYSFKIARNGAEALSLYRSLTPRAMLMNIQLPRISGMEVTGAIRSGEIETGQHLPVVGLAVSGDAAVRETCISAGMDHFLALPIDPDLLLATIASCLEAEPAAVDPVPEDTVSEVSVAEITCDSRGDCDLASETDYSDQRDNGPHTRMLLAEDNQVNHEVFLELFEDRPYDVTGVWDGREAVVRYIANASAFDVIMMDMAMPVMNGIEAIKAIRAHERIKGLMATPIIGVSADTTEELRQQAALAGVNDYLIKPVDVDELLNCLARCKIDKHIEDLRETTKDMIAANDAGKPQPSLTIADLARKYQIA